MNFDSISASMKVAAGSRTPRDSSERIASLRSSESVELSSASRACGFGVARLAPRSRLRLGASRRDEMDPSLTTKGLRFLPEYAEDESGYVDVASAIPDLGTLFGSLSSCKCEECRSILGPSAYLADLLHWLDDRRLTDDSGSALDFLVGSADGTSILGRRPDLADLNLTCENATRVLPYIDLTLE